MRKEHILITYQNKKNEHAIVGYPVLLIMLIVFAISVCLLFP
jgi:hypothetical protein